MRESVIVSSSRMSASSSTTSTCVLVIGCPAENPETRTLGRVHVIELGVVRFAHFAGDVESQASPAGRCRGERLEELAAHPRRDTGTIVTHLQFYRPAIRARVDRDTN